MQAQLRAISSMATRQVLADLCAQWEARGGTPLTVESVGGVDAARRVHAGEAFDLVFLASDAIDKLLVGGQLLAGSRVDLMRSEVAAAVRVGAARPAWDDAECVRRAVLSASRIGYSTGPSGTALLALFQRWGLTEQLEPRLVQARAGVPVARLLAQGEVDLGFQQRAELLGAPGIEILGDLPDPIRITTVFSAGVATTCTQRDAAARVLAFMAAPGADGAKRLHGMDAASANP